MLKQQIRPVAAKPQDRTHRTTGINLAVEIWELLNRVVSSDHDDPVDEAPSRRSFVRLVMDWISRLQKWGA